MATSGWSIYTNGTSATFPRVRQHLQFNFYEKPPSYYSAACVSSLQQVERPADLVDGECSLAVTLWASDRQVVNAVLRRSGGAVRMTDGTEVRIRVRVSWFARRGQVSLRMLSNQS